MENEEGKISKLSSGQKAPQKHDLVLQPRDL